jgi:hypothetical protein
MTTAENSVGNDSSAIAAFGDEQGGSFVYHIIIGKPRTSLLIQEAARY